MPNYPDVYIKAKFIGTHGSLGYRHGEYYHLKIDGQTICRPNGTGFCPYGSVESFLNNWTDIEHYSNPPRTYPSLFDNDSPNPTDL